MRLNSTPRRSISLALTLALLPALALAAPRKKPKKPAKPAATKPEPAKPIVEPTPDPTEEPTEPKRGATPTAPTSPTGSTAGGAGSGNGPAPVEPPKPVEPVSQGTDVDTLRQEYLSLRDELFKSRARANAVSSQLYSTRVTIKLAYTTGRYYNPTKVSIRLDGASVYDDASGAIAKDDGVRFTGFVAPGRHVLTFRIEAAGKDDDSFSSATEAQVTVKAVAGKDLVITGKARDTGDIAYAWKREERGSYGLAIDVGVKTEKAPK